MLIVWSSSKKEEIKDVVGPVLAVDNTPHKLHTEYGTPPEVEDGDVVLACGGKAVEILQNLGLVAKNRTIGSLRETPIIIDKDNPLSAKILVTYEPSLIKKDYSKLPEIQWDVQLACRLHNTGSTNPTLGRYEYTESLHDIVEYIDGHTPEDPADISADLETVGLDEYNEDAYIVSLTITHKVGQSLTVYFARGERPVQPKEGVPFTEMTYWELLWTQINWILTTTKASTKGANFKFDSRWLVHKWGIYCTNFKMDTLLAGSLLDENRSNSLKLHAKVFTKLGGYETEAKKYDFSRVDLIPKDDLLPYAGGDTDATLQVAHIFRKQLIRQPRLANFYINVLHPSSLVFEKMERNGINVDQEYYTELQIELESEKERLEQQMVGMLPSGLQEKHSERIELAFSEGKNPMTPAVLKDFLFTDDGLGLIPMMVTEKTKQPSTAIDHLMMFSDNSEAKEFIDSFKEYGSVTKTLSTYVIGFLKHLRSDGKWHPNFMLFRGGYGGDDDDAGTVTGRTSAKDPAVQTIPKHTRWSKRLRRAIIAPEGHTILQCVSPETRIWLDDLTWKKAKDLTLGDRLFAFDEVPEKGKHRKMRTAVVEGLVAQKVRRLRLTFDDGTSVICARHHQWLSWYGTGQKFRQAKNLRVGNCIRRVTHVYEKLNTYDAGWLGGMFDGEGWSSGKHGDGWTTGIAQKHGMTLDKLKTVLDENGYYYTDSTNSSEVPCLRITDTFEVFRLYQQCRPERLIAKKVWEGFAMPRLGSIASTAQRATITNIEDIGIGDVISIKTDTGTYVAEGLASHNCDYSQGELKIAACVANEETMIEAYQNGIDLHAVTAAQLNGYELEDFMLLPEDIRDELRSSGKAGNFGLLYGMGAKGFKEYAQASYGVSMTEEEAYQKREAFFALYSRLPEWHENSRETARQTLQIESPLGRIRHLPLINSKDNEVRASAERQAINSPIQATLSDLMQLAMVTVDREYGQKDAKMFMMTHDSIALYIPIGQEELWARRVTEIMANLPLKKLFGWSPQLQFTADAEVAVPDENGIISLASLKKFKLPKVTHG